MQITHPVNNFYLNSNLRNISSQFSAATKEVKNFLETTYEIFSFALNYNLFTVNLNHPWIYSELRTFSFSVSIKKIIIGTAGGIALLSINSFVSSKIYDLMAAHGFDVLSSKQDALQLFDFGYYTSNKIIGFLLTATVATYIGVIGPVFEESVFRGFIYNETEIWLNSNTISAKAFNIVSNGFVFGLAHLYLVS